MNNIPGSETLGWGFNIFGPYSDSSITSQLFDINVQSGSQQWTDPATKVTYLVPNNVSTPVPPNTPSSIEYQVFDSRSDVQKYFSSKAQVDMGLVSEFGVFSGSFNAAFSAEVNSTNEYKYAIVNASAVVWEVGLETQSLDKLTKSVQADIASLPTAYSIEQRQLFFAFFDKYGTHFISRVTVGGRLYYNVAIQNSYGSIADDGKIQVQLEYEFSGLFGSKAEADAEWKNVTQDWMNSRSVQIQVIGGATEALASVNPVFGENDNSVYQAWIGGIQNAPAVVDFILRPIAALFPIAQQDAMKQAYNDYLASGIIAISTSAIPYAEPLPSPKQSVPAVVLSGKPIAPDYDPLYSIGFLVAVMKEIDATLTEVVLLNYYSMDLWGQDLNYPALFDEMARQINAATDVLGDDYILVVVSFNWNYYAAPSAAFQAVLYAAGAGSVLDEWISGQGDSAGSIGPGYDCNYCLVGKGGTSRTAAEAMDVSAASPESTRLRARIDERGNVQQLNVG